MKALKPIYLSAQGFSELKAHVADSKNHRIIEGRKGFGRIELWQNGLLACVCVLDERRAPKRP